MRLVALNELQPGMILARAIFREDDGGILLRPNIELKPSYIERIKDLKYNYIYILDSQVPQNEIITETINEETRFKARGLLKKAASQLLKDEAISTVNFKRIVTELVDQVFNDIHCIYNMVDIRSYENYIYSHSVNVCILALLIGMELGFNRSQMENLGIGALFHDIGRIFINPKTLDQFGHSDPKENEQIKKHARLGYDTLKNKFDVNFLAAHVALQHHEREDGSGYPRGLTGKRIHRFAKIVAVADAYDSMISQRIRSIPSHQAVQGIKAEMDVKFDRTTVECFTKVIAPYLLGTVLQLSNGDIALVTGATRNECQVMIIEGSLKGKSLNLYQNPDLFVDKVLNVK